jgi:hypothetical protein
MYSSHESHPGPKTSTAPLSRSNVTESKGEKVIKKQYRYRITLEALASAEDTPEQLPAPLRFEAASHDDIFDRVQLVRRQSYFDANTAAVFTVGLKLLGEALLQNRKHPVFEEFYLCFGQFMKRIKEDIKNTGNVENAAVTAPSLDADEKRR